ncbi:post-segregation killing protein PndC [Salmonella enterica]|nr:post-segregation killing protein PndC [Salmonella enterica]
MSTHSIISVVCRDGLIRSAYCHQDGYLQHSGRILVEHYNSQEKAEALIAPGNMSCLRARCDKPEGHTGDSPVAGVTVYWTRDAGCPADETAARVYPDAEASMEGESDSTTGYYYLYDGSCWMVKYHTNRGWQYRPLRQALRNAARRAA